MFTLINAVLDWAIGLFDNRIKQTPPTPLGMRWRLGPEELYIHSLDSVENIEYSVENNQMAQINLDWRRNTAAATADPFLRYVGTAEDMQSDGDSIEANLRDRFLYQPIETVATYPGVTLNSFDISTGTANITYHVADTWYQPVDSNAWHVTIGSDFGTQDGIDKFRKFRRKHINLIFKSPRDNSRQVLPKNISPDELRARDTLRDMITENEFRRYLTNGFIMVKGPSGLWYQIFSNQIRIRVYEKGKKVAHLCIHTDEKCPPSDHTINMKLMVEFDEMAVWQNSGLSNINRDCKIALPFINRKYRGLRFSDEQVMGGNLVINGNLAVDMPFAVVA